MKIKANGINLNYEQWGEGPDLVLVHGTGGNLGYWEKQVFELTRRNRVTVYDQRGFGLSDVPENGYAMSDYAADLFELTRALQIQKACFLGFSMGGRVVMQMAASHPEVVGALILSNCGAGELPPMDKQALGVIQMLEGGMKEKVFQMLTDIAFSPGFRSRNPEVWQRYYQMHVDNPVEGLVRLMKAGLGVTIPGLAPGKLRCPALFIQGEHDPSVTPERRIQSQAAVPGSRLVLLPAGHACSAEMPDDYNRVVSEFLGSVAWPLAQGKRSNETKIDVFVEEMREKSARALLEVSRGGRQERKRWPFGLGWADVIVIRGGAIDKAVISELVLNDVVRPGTSQKISTKVYQMEIYPANPYCPMGHFNTEWTLGDSPVYRGNLDLFPAIRIEEDLQAVKAAMDGVVRQFGHDPDQIRQGLVTQYNMDHFSLPLAASVGCKFGGLPETEIEFYMAAYRTLFDSYLELLKRRVEMPFKREQELIKLERNGRWLQYIALKDRAVKSGTAAGVPVEALKEITFPPSALF